MTAMSDVLSNRDSLEKFYISRLGFATRVFPEDPKKAASWGYTVGMRNTGNPVCIFLRGEVDTDTLDNILADAAGYFQDKAIPFLPFTNKDLFVPSKAKLRMKFKAINPDVVEAIKEKLGNFIEGQKPDTKYYWLLLADKNNKLPGEEGYEDFQQLANKETPEDVGSLLNSFDD